MVSLLKCRKFEVVREEEPGDGRSLPREYVLHPGAVVVLPLLEQDRCVMVRQFRRAIDQELLELPAGTLDVPGESLEAAVARELQEETGYRAAAIRALCAFFPSPGILSEKISAFVCRAESAGAPSPEPGEHVAPLVVSLGEAYQMIRERRIMDAKTIITLLAWQEMGRPMP